MGNHFMGGWIVEITFSRVKKNVLWTTYPHLVPSEEFIYLRISYCYEVEESVFNRIRLISRWRPLNTHIHWQIWGDSKHKMLGRKCISYAPRWVRVDDSSQFIYYEYYINIDVKQVSIHWEKLVSKRAQNWRLSNLIDKG